MAYTISQIIQFAKISQLEAEKDIAISTAINGGRLDKRLPLMLYTERKSLEWMYEQSPSLFSLYNTGQYVLALCGRYLFKAIHATIGGGVVVGGTTLQVAQGYTEREVRFIVGGDGALVAAGSRVIVISDNNIVYGSVEVHADGTKLYTPAQSDRLSFDVAYTSNSITITINADAYTDQAFDIKYKKWVAASSSSLGDIGYSEPIYYTADGTEGVTINRSDLYGKTLGLLSRDGRILRKVSGTPGVGQFFFDNNTLDGATPTGTITFGVELSAGEDVSWSVAGQGVTVIAASVQEYVHRATGAEGYILNTPLANKEVIAVSRGGFGVMPTFENSAPVANTNEYRYNLDGTIDFGLELTPGEVVLILWSNALIT